MYQNIIMEIDVSSKMRLKSSMRPNVVISENYCTCFKIEILDDGQFLKKSKIKMKVYIVTHNIELIREGGEVELRAGKEVFARGLISKVIYSSSNGWPD
jgi:hypothetical protein